jgi:hypothetical protein
MAGAGGKEVGRLSIRVVPDMDGFRRDVETGAEAAAHAVEPKVDVGADTTKARDEIRVIEDEKYGAVVNLDADTGRARARIEEATRPRKVNVKVDYDEGALDRVKKNIDRFLTNEGIEMGRAHQRLLSTMRSAAPQRQNFDLRLDPNFDYALRNRLRKISTEESPGFWSRLIGRGGGGSGGGGGGGRFGGRGGSFDILPNIGGLGGVPSLVLILGALSLLAPALSLVSQALVGLPALVAGVALPIGVFAIGMKGIKGALDDSGLMELVTGKTNKKGEKTGKDKQTLGEGLKEVQDQVSAVFKTGFTPLFREIAGALPALTRGLPFVARGIVDLAGGLTKALVSPQNIANFDRFTNSVSAMLTNLGPGLGSFTTGMTTLITNVGDHLPGLGNTMSEWAGRFNNWVTEISKPQQFWGQDVPNSSPLDRAVSNMKPILNSVVGFVGTLMDKGIEMASSKGMTDSIVGTIDGLLGLIERALPALRDTFDVLADGMRLFGKDTSNYDSKKQHGNGDGYFWGMPTDGKPVPVNPVGDGPQHKDATGPLGDLLLKANPLSYIYDMLFRSDVTDQRNKQPKDNSGTGKSTLPGWFDPEGWGVDLKANMGKFFHELFGGIGPTGAGIAGAAPEQFNAGTRVGGPTAPVPVQVVGPAPTGAVGNAGALPSTPVPQVPAQAQPPEIKAPKIEAPKPPPGSDRIWEPMINATHTAGAQLNGEVSSWAGVIKAALDSAAAGAGGSGAAIGAAFAAGIRSSTYQVQAAAVDLAAAAKSVFPHSPAPDGPFSGTGWDQVKTSGGAIASQFADGLDGGFEGVRSASQRLAQSVHDSMTNNGGVLPPGLSAAIKRESAAIGIELDKLKQQKDALDPKDKGGRAAIQAQMKELQGLRTELGLDSKQSKYDSQYGGANGEGPFNQQNVGSMITQGLASALNAMVGFPKANLSQLETDLGMSGHGVVEQLGDYGVNFLTSSLNSLATGFFGGGKDGQKGSTTNIYTTDMDGAFQAKTRMDNRLAMQHTQRSN